MFPWFWLDDICHHHFRVFNFFGIGSSPLVLHPAFSSSRPLTGPEWFDRVWFLTITKRWTVLSRKWSRYHFQWNIDVQSHHGLNNIMDWIKKCVWDWHSLFSFFFLVLFLLFLLFFLLFFSPFLHRPPSSSSKMTKTKVSQTTQHGQTLPTLLGVGRIASNQEIGDFQTPTEMICGFINPSNYRCIYLGPSFLVRFSYQWTFL